MWALKVTYEDGSEELIGPFVYRADAEAYINSGVDETAELLALHSPIGGYR